MTGRRRLAAAAAAAVEMIGGGDTRCFLPVEAAAVYSIWCCLVGEEAFAQINNVLWSMIVIQTNDSKAKR